MEKVIFFYWVPIPNHVAIRGNELADATVVEATRLSSNDSNSLPYYDYYSIIKPKMKMKWELEWQNLTSNKRREIKPTTKV